ncbi:MAG TPA: DJ-1/PfpI family protein [Tissierellia bacterium]|nr:DJ-1/PfpI family protein [Tissierellia bacterium]
MKKMLMLLAEGFEEVEAVTVIDYLRRMNIIVDTCSINGERKVIGGHRITIETDKDIDKINSIKGYDGLIIPGGREAAIHLRDDGRVIELIKAFHDEGKILAAICAGPIVLNRAGILNGRKVTSYPGFDNDLKNSEYKDDIIVEDGNIITARGPAVAVYFALKLIEILAGEERVGELRNDILLDKVEEAIGK